MHTLSSCSTPVNSVTSTWSVGQCTTMLSGQESLGARRGGQCPTKLQLWTYWNATNDLCVSLGVSLFIEMSKNCWYIWYIWSTHQHVVWSRIFGGKEGRSMPHKTSTLDISYWYATNDLCVSLGVSPEIGK